MTQVLIDRELLERCRARLYGLMQADLGTELAALLADHTEQHLEMVEQPVEVVGYLDAHDCLWNETTHPDRMIPLMTVGQHQRILAQLTRPAQTEQQGLRIVLDGPPGPDAGRFVEVENAAGRSVNAGEWRERADGLWELVLHASQGGE